MSLGQKTGKSNIDVKRINRNRVFRHIIRQQRVSQPEIASALGISVPTVLQITKELQKKKVLRQVGEFASTGGRKAKAMAPIRDARYAVGLDITKNHIGLVFTDLSGEVLQHVRLAKPFVYGKKYFTELGRSVTQFVSRTDIPLERLLGVGVSIPGIIDERRKCIAFSHALGLRDVPYAEFSRCLPYNCLFVNDANAAAMTEISGVDDGDGAIYLSLSNSVGGAIITKDDAALGEGFNYDQYLYIGDNFRSAEFGHVTLVPNGRTCYCGQHGCFDAYCSAKQLADLVGGRLEDFFARLLEGDRKLQRQWEQYLDFLAIQVNNLRMIFDSKVIIGGYVGGFMDQYMGELRRRIQKLGTFQDSGEYVRACRYKVEASALGAALLHIEQFIAAI